MHAYHQGLPNYSPNQILHDGCAECEDRGQREDHGLSTLDRSNFARAWERAADWNRFDGPTITDISRAEAGLLRVLWSVQLHLERLGVPLGQLPHWNVTKVLTVDLDAPVIISDQTGSGKS